MKRYSAAALLLCAASVTYASDFYAGGGLGIATAGMKCDTGTECHDHGIGYTAYFGYHANDYLGGEFGYTNIGSATGKIAGVTHISVTGSGVYIAAVGRLKLDEGIHAVARLGAIDMRTSLGAAGETFQSSDWTPYVGLGVEVKLSPKLSVGPFADFSKLKLDSSTQVSSFTGVQPKASTVHLFGADVEYQF